MAGVEIRLYPDRMAELTIRTTHDAARRAAETTERRVKQNIVSSGRVDTGRMLASVDAMMVSQTVTHAEWRVVVDTPYAIYQEKGIGPVHARPGHVLRFRPKGSATFIFRPRTRGFAGAHFMQRAYSALSTSDFLP